jgi:hypothetical protein
MSLDAIESAGRGRVNEVFADLLERLAEQRAPRAAGSRRQWSSSKNGRPAAR